MSKQITITIDTGNAAFDDGNAGIEVARILREAAGRIEELAVEDFDGIRLRDYNGNTVGRVMVGETDEGDECPRCGGDWTTDEETES